VTALSIDRPLFRRSLSELFPKSDEKLHTFVVTTENASATVSASPDTKASTSSVGVSAAVWSEATGLFEAACDESFYDGIDSQFSRALTALVVAHRATAIQVVTDLIVNEQVSSEAASEALRCVGRMDDPFSHSDRRWLLERCLFSPDELVRDGAGSGLLALNDAHATQYIRRAIQNETDPDVRFKLEQVLARLESR